ncbi:uncharacterized protein LOC117535227 [Gymnodraco acuticeps]|uniref:Uncharacterized protein LOC117535227 n=1 Tax=Gymnodraco acuticeps TaxID=8218 RepID=A0A6P8SXU8_GYMAC|nr:uncharacterized protein LOC117535227 [Gymnodraco acuticeps]
MFALKQCFWWPSMANDVGEYVNACPVCARSKTSSRSWAGLLQPLPIPQRPWSDISMDFVTGLPVSRGLTPFQCVFGYQPPVFAETEKEVLVPSAHALVRRSHRIWAATRRTLLRSSSSMKRGADRHRRASSSVPVWAEGVVVHEISTPPCRFKKISPQVCWSFSNNEDCEPCVCAPATPQVLSGPPYIPHWEDQACQGKQFGARN